MTHVPCCEGLGLELEIDDLCETESKEKEQEVYCDTPEFLSEEEVRILNVLFDELIGDDSLVYETYARDAMAFSDSARIAQKAFSELENKKTKPADGQSAVEHPKHYNFGKIEVIDAIEDWDLGFSLGNAVKYIARAGKKSKEKEVEDLEKAVWYIQRYINNLKKE